MTNHASADHTGAALAANVLRASRRQLLCGGGAVAVAALLTACSGGSGDSGETQSPGQEPGAQLATLDEIPVGGGIVTSDLVLVQPTAGQVKAFSRSCPHMHNPVDAPKDGIITCPYHGSKFKAEDGSLVNGPATTGLTEVKVTVSDGKVLRA